MDTDEGALDSELKQLHQKLSAMEEWGADSAAVASEVQALKADLNGNGRDSAGEEQWLGCSKGKRVCFAVLEAMREWKEAAVEQMDELLELKEQMRYNLEQQGPGEVQPAHGALEELHKEQEQMKEQWHELLANRPCIDAVQRELDEIRQEMQNLRDVQNLNTSLSNDPHSQFDRKASPTLRLHPSGPQGNLLDSPGFASAENSPAMRVEDMTKPNIDEDDNELKRSWPIRAAEWLPSEWLILAVLLVCLFVSNYGWHHLM